jgi:glucose-1-phosphate adenylyltransferase
VRNTMALVLSGGGGERLSVLTEERAVSALPFGGKYRVVDFVLSNGCHSGLEYVGVITQHAPISLHDHIGAGRTWDLDRRGGGVVVLQPFQTRQHSAWYRGTADAIAQNWDAIEDRRPSRVLVLSGDHVYRMDYRALLATHLEERAAATLAVTRVPPDQTRRFGMVTLDRDGRVRTLVEKPERADTPWASMGIYMFDTGVLRSYLSNHPVHLVHDVVRPMLAAGERVASHPFEGYWEDIGTVGSFYRSNLELVARAPRFALYDERWPILTRDEERPPVRVQDDARLEDSLVANGCSVDGIVRRSVLFPGVTVDPGAEVVESVVMSDTHIGAGARVFGSILDKYVRVEPGAEIGGGEPDVSPESAWLEGLTLVGKDALIPSDARIGRSVVIGIGTRPADFGELAVAPGTVLGSRPWFEVAR